MQLYHLLKSIPQKGPTNYYISRHLRGSKEEPMLSVFPDIQKMQAEAIANATSEEEAE